MEDTTGEPGVLDDLPPRPVAGEGVALLLPLGLDFANRVVFICNKVKDAPQDVDRKISHL